MRRTRSGARRPPATGPKPSKLLYNRRRRYYAEHLAFTLHVHAFVFVMFTIMLLLPWSGVNGVLVLWLGAYVWLAMKRVYARTGSARP